MKTVIGKTRVEASETKPKTKTKTAPVGRKTAAIKSAATKDTGSATRSTANTSNKPLNKSTNKLSKAAAKASIKSQAPVPVASPSSALKHALALSGSNRRAGRNDPALFAQIVAELPLAGFDAITVIRQGYPARMMKAASSYFTVPDARIQEIIRVPASTAIRLEKKQARIDPAATERIFRMGMVTRMAIEVFEDQIAAVAWMRAPNRALANAAPLDLMDTEPGAVSVRLILNAIACGGAA